MEKETWGDILEYIEGLHGRHPDNQAICNIMAGNHHIPADWFSLKNWQDKNGVALTVVQIAYLIIGVESAIIKGNHKAIDLTEKYYRSKTCELNTED